MLKQLKQTFLLEVPAQKKESCSLVCACMRANVVSLTGKSADVVLLTGKSAYVVLPVSQPM